MSRIPKWIKTLNMENFILGLQDKRKNGISVSFKAELNRQYEITPSTLYAGLGIDTERFSFGDLWAGDKNILWIAPEYIRACVIKGLKMRQYEQYIIGATQTGGEMIQEFPYLDMTEMASKKAERRGPGTSFREFPFAMGSKYVSAKEVGAGIKFPYGYNFLKKVKLSVLPIFFMAFGDQLGIWIWDDILDALLAGDGGVTSLNQSDKSVVDQTPVEIGVETTGAFTEDDFLGAVIQMSSAAKPATAMIAQPKHIKDTLKFDSFKTDKHPGEIKADLVTPLPSKLSLIPILDSRLENKVVLLNKSTALIKFIVDQLLVEAQKVIEKKIEEAFASITVGVANGLRGGRLIIDMTKEYSDADYADWFYRS